MAFDASIPVLVVDDNRTSISILRRVLWQLGFLNVDDASDGEAALARMRSKRYGLVISDWNMETMSGHDFLREVRGDPQLKHIPFIMITAEHRTEHVIAAKKAGVSAYILKPFDARTLKTKMESLLAAGRA